MFPLSEYVSDVEALERANVPVTEGLAQVVAELPDGPCRASLQTLLDLQRQKSAIRQSTIAAGKANNLTTVILDLREYAKINSSSPTAIAARTAATQACGLEV